MLSFIDSAIIILYLLALFAFGILIGRKEGLEDFLINNRKTKLFFLIFTIVSTNVGAGIIIGTAAASYETGISFGISLIISEIAAFLLIALLAPRIKRFGDKHKAHTLAEFFGVRYSNSNKLLVAGIIVIAYFFWTAIQFVALATLAKVVTGWDFNLILIFVAISTIIYTSFAGIKSDFYTDVVHFWVMVLTLFLVLVPLAFAKAGGFSALANLPAGYYNPFSFGGPVIFFGALIFGSILLLPAMEVWQRIYASSNEKEAKKALLWSAAINIPFTVVAVFLGLIAASLYTGINRDESLFVLMNGILPAGLLGLGIAGILATIISTVNSGMLVGSITILKDFYKNVFNKNASERNMLLMGRIFYFYDKKIFIYSYHSFYNFNCSRN